MSLSVYSCEMVRKNEKRNIINCHPFTVLRTFIKIYIFDLKNVHFFILSFATAAKFCSGLNGKKAGYTQQAKSNNKRWVKYKQKKYLELN